jgi:dTDP-glucose pyrophosphorylase
MIEHVVDAFPVEAHKIFIVLKEHDEQYNAVNMLRAKWPDCDVILIDDVTDGAACSVLKAKHLIDNDDVLAVMNSDNIIRWNPKDLDKLHWFDGMVMTFEDSDPKWSFAKIDTNGIITEVVEKKPVSTHATAGLYFWTKGKNFVHAAEQMIAKDIRVNNEFYVAPVYTQNAEIGQRCVIAQVIEMNGVGVPEDLEAYIKKMESSD